MRDSPGATASSVCSASSAGRGPRSERRRAARAAEPDRRPASRSGGEPARPRCAHSSKRPRTFATPMPSAVPDPCRGPRGLRPSSSSGSAVAGEPLELVDAGSAAKLRTRIGGDDCRASASPVRSPASRARSAAALGDRRPASRRTVLRVREIELELHVEAERPGQLERPLEQRARRSIVAPARARGGRRRRAARPLARRARGRAVRARPCSGPPARGGSRGSRPARPGRPRAPRARPRSARAARRESPSAGRRRRRRGSGGGGSGSRRRRGAAALSGRISSLRTSEASRGVIWPSSEQRLDRAAVEELALDGAALEHRSLRLLELVEPGGEQRLQRRRNGDLAFRLVAPSRPSRSRRAGCRRPRARSARAGRPGRSPGSARRRRVLGQRLEPQRRPATAGGARASSGRARQRSRIGAPVESSATCSTRSRKVSSPHWMSSKTTDERAPAPRAACGTPRRSPRPTCALVRLAEQRAERRRGRGIGRKRVELLQHLDHRPVGDPLAVGEAAAADDSRIDRARGTRPSAATCRPRRRRRP